MGIVTVIHTFGADIKWHAHLHLLVTEGGLSLDGDAYFGASGGTVSVEVEGAFRSKWRDHFGDVALPFRHMWRGPEPRSESDAG
jgi:hypothetical protein